MKTVYQYSDAQLLALIQANINIQKASPFSSAAASSAREANRVYFDEAKRRGLKGVVS